MCLDCYGSHRSGTSSNTFADGARLRPPAMLIALVRHGKPNLDPWSPVAGQHLDSWLDAYNRAGIDHAFPPPVRVRELAGSVSCLLSSDRLRACESLRMLAPGREARAEQIFREAGLPRLPSVCVRLDPRLWALLARIGWFLGWSNSTESPSRARHRARAAAQQLAGLAVAHHSVLLMGHGFFNALIARELRTEGWRGPVLPTGRYWSAAVYRKDVT